MFYTVYILKSGNNVYKGMTNDLKRRLSEHLGGHTKTTRKMKNIEVVYTEEFDNFEDARARELYFKSSAGRRFLKNKI